MKLFGIVIGIFLIGNVLWIAQAHAVVDQKCFTKAMCDGAGGTFEQRPPCAGQLGFCFPKPTPIALNLAIGGKMSVTNLAEYLQIGYQYFVGVGTLIAILLIMIGGVQWLMAGGRSGAVESAKQRIQNAVLGLAMLLGSYLLLFTINPDLVKLKIPRVALVRQEALAVQGSCQLNSQVKMVEKGGTSYEELKAADFKPEADVKPQCGKEYYLEDYGGATCQGYICPAGTGCFQNKCKVAKITGTIKGVNTGLPVLDNDLQLYVLCNSGKIHQIADYDVTEVAANPGGLLNQEFAYYFDYEDSKISSESAKCGMTDDNAGFAVRGYFFDAEVNDQTSGVQTAANIGAQLIPGVGPVYAIMKTKSDDFYGLGRNIEAAKQGECLLSENLCKHAKWCDTKKDEFNDTDSSMGGAPDDGILLSRKADETTKDYIHPEAHTFTETEYNEHTKLNSGYCQTPLCMYLLPRDWIDKGKQCNIIINREQFPVLP